MLAGFGEKYGLDQGLAVKLTRAFGSGMGRGDVCGAPVGAFMVMGIHFQDGSDERRIRYQTYDLVNEFVRQFEKHHGSIRCIDLMGGVDLGTEAGRQFAVQNNLFSTICPKYVKDAGEILDRILSKHDS